MIRNEIANIFIDKYNMLLGGVVGIMTTIFGIYWYVFAGYLLLNIFDWLTGWVKARKMHKESSAVGLKGIIKKLGYWVMIAVAFLMSEIFINMGRDVLNVNLDFLLLIGWFTIASLMINEIRSVLENLIELGYKVPVIFIKGLETTEKLMNEECEND